MTANHDTPAPVSSASRQARWLRRTAAVVLLLGIVGADLIYWLGTRSVDSSNPLPVAGEDKAETRRAELMMGKQTVLMDEWSRDLKRPGTQAAVVIVTAALAAGGCFYCARLLDHSNKDADEKGLPQS